MSFGGIGNAGNAILGFWSITQPPSGTVEIIPTRGNSVLLLLAEPPDRAGGVGGWQTTERMFQRPARWFQAPPVDTMTISGILDRDEHARGHTIKTRLGWLYDMARAGKQDEPPIVKLWGDIAPYDQRLKWVVQDITLGDRIMSGAGTFVLQHVTVALEGYDALPRVAKASVRRTRATGGAAPQRRVIRTLKGDTLRTIAVKQLGTSGQYTLLRQWNKQFAQTDPDQPLKPGLLMVLH